MILDPDVWLSHMSWYVTPGAFKDGAGASGGTIQSRITCKKGSHQTDPPEVQACWSSRWRDGFLISYDLKQIELCTAGLLSGEPFLCEAIRNGWDLHSRRALKLWKEPALLARYPSLLGVPVDRWKKASSLFNDLERQVGKRVNFADLFRSGAATMQASVLGDIGELLPLPFFQDAVDNRPRDVPLLWAWQEERIAEARLHGCVTLPFTGQSRQFLGGDKYDVNEIVNFPVQATASNTHLRIQIYIHRAIRNARRRDIFPVLNIYDALKFDCASQSAIDFLDQTYEEAIVYVRDNEYWSWLQDTYGRTVPLEYEREGYQNGEEVKALRKAGPQPYP